MSKVFQKLVLPKMRLLSRRNKCWRMAVASFCTNTKAPGLRLADKTCIVTGAASGLGYETAKLFTKNGAKVIGVDIDSNGLQSLKQNVGCDVVEGDVSNEEDVKRYMEIITGNYSKIDVLVNNAGIIGHVGAILDCSTETFDKVLKTNVFGAFWNCKYLVPAMLGKGVKMSIINVSSVGAHMAVPGFGPYTTSKNCLFGLTKAIAAEYVAFGVRCNSVHPGWVETALVQKAGLGPEQVEAVAATMPTKRLAKPEDIMPMALFLASDESEWCNGQGFIVDQGASTKM